MTVLTTVRPSDAEAAEAEQKPQALPAGRIREARPQLGAMQSGPRFLAAGKQGVAVPFDHPLPELKEQFERVFSTMARIRLNSPGLA